jgi:glycosyltransferase involved in cell wall biosynthesis
MMHPQDPPLVSVVMPAFNAARFIQRAIDSVLQQTYANIELIIIDDGSSDDTVPLLARLSAPNVTAISQENAGAGHARNRGIEASRGTFIAYLDADDYWLPRKIERQIAVMLGQPEVGFCSTATRVESPTGEFLNLWPCPAAGISALHSLFENTAAIAGSASGVLVRSSLQRKVGLFDESLRGNEDTDMWLRLAAAGRYACIPEALAVIVRQTNSRSGNFGAMRESSLRVLRKNRPLLDAESQHDFWRNAYAGVICDYAKWEARCGHRISAMGHLLKAWTYAPISKARLCASLALAILTNQSL